MPTFYQYFNQSCSKGSFRSCALTSLKTNDNAEYAIHSTSMVLERALADLTIKSSLINGGNKGSTCPALKY